MRWGRISLPPVPEDPKKPVLNRIKRFSVGIRKAKRMLKPILTFDGQLGERKG